MRLCQYAPTIPPSTPENLGPLQPQQLPAFTVELGMTDRGATLLLDLFSTRWQALLTHGPSQATAFLWQQVLHSLLDRHSRREIQVLMYSPRPQAFAWLVERWENSWFLTANARHFLDTLTEHFLRLPAERDLPLTVALLDDMDTFLLESEAQSRHLQVMVLEGSRRSMRFLGSRQPPLSGPGTHPVWQCFSQHIFYQRYGWYLFQDGPHQVPFRLTLNQLQIPRD